MEGSKTDKERINKRKENTSFLGKISNAAFQLWDMLGQYKYYTGYFLMGGMTLFGMKACLFDRILPISEV